METEGRAIVTAICVVGFIGFMIGSFVTVSKFQINAYDCTIVCPGNAESIQYKGECYCKLEAK